MNRIPVTSSNIESIGYDPQQRILEVEFKDGSVYQYDRVPATVYRDLMAAESHGTYLANYIRYQYSYRKIR